MSAGVFVPEVVLIESIDLISGCLSEVVTRIDVAEDKC